MSPAGRNLEGGCLCGAIRYRLGSGPCPRHVEFRADTRGLTPAG